MIEIQQPAQVLIISTDSGEAEAEKRPYEAPKVVLLGSMDVVQYGNGNNLDGTNGWWFPDN
jgi:hypothetical protein